MKKWMLVLVPLFTHGSPAYANPKQYSDSAQLEEINYQSTFYDNGENALQVTATCELTSELEIALYVDGQEKRKSIFIGSNDRCAQNLRNIARALSRVNRSGQGRVIGICDATTKLHKISLSSRGVNKVGREHTGSDQACLQAARNINNW